MRTRELGNGMFLCELRIGQYIYMFTGTQKEITDEAQELLDKAAKGLI